MIPNHSPWIRQLARTRSVVPLAAHAAADVVIVGGGIAGVTSAYYTLTRTKASVMLLEADKVAHGATGHNAGQIASYFERPLSEIAAEFGEAQAADAQRSVESAWVLLDEIVQEAKLQTPVYRFTGYAGLSSLAQVILRLRDNRVRLNGGLPPEPMVIAEEWSQRGEIPADLTDLYTTVPHADLLSLIEAKNTDYIAALSYQKGCLNSALFSEELVGYLLATFPTRFSLFESSPVSCVQLSKDTVVLTVREHAVTAGKVVLATNGFENFSIEHDGPAIDTTFHHSVAGRIGYMAGYVEPLTNPPIAISYFPRKEEKTVDPTGESYFYLTRRPHEHEGSTSYNLVCVGGPDKPLPNQALYIRDEVSLDDVPDAIDAFLRENYQLYPKEGVEYAFCWHGLMGYTPSGVRRVGPEPLNPRLLYNLGCNGVGILPSIWGGKRISEYLAGTPVAPSIFDPHDQRE